jgi:hypothetical protein
MVDRKVVPFDEFYYQLKLMHLFQKQPVYVLSLMCLQLLVAVDQDAEFLYR